MPDRELPRSSSPLDEQGQHRRLINETAQLVELRVGLANLTAEVHRVRTDLSPLANMPVQLQALSQLWQERLDHAVAQRERDVADLRADVDELRSWQTWLTRLVVGAVAAAVLALVLTSSPELRP